MKNATIFGHRVKKGLVQLIRVDYSKVGKATVTPMGEWRPILRGDCLRWAANVRKASAGI